MEGKFTEKYKGRDLIMNGINYGTIHRTLEFTPDKILKTPHNLWEKFLFWLFPRQYKIPALIFWYGSTDNSTITESANRVSQWDDKGSGGTSGEKPLTVI